MKRITARFLVLALPLAACLATAARPSLAQRGDLGLADEIDAEEYAVYSAIIDGLDKREGEAGGKAERVLVVSDMTEPWHDFTNEDVFYAGLKESSKELLDETIEDYKARNRKPHKLSPRLSVKVRYALVDAGEIAGFFKKNGPAGWKDFYSKYPTSGGFITFSRVGFNSDKTQALVYQSRHCGGLCGEGSCLLFVKKDGAWVEKGIVGGMWMS
jgi:hypothetical protein